MTLHFDIPRHLKSHPVLLLILVLVAGIAKAQDVETYIAQSKKAQGYFDYSGALKLLNKAVKLDPSHVGARMERGNLQLMLEKYKNANEDFSAIVATDASYSPAWVGIADVFRFTNQLDTAMKCAEKAQVLAQNELHKARAQIALAEIYLSNEQDSIAAVYFIRSLETDSTNVPAMKKLAYLLSEKHMYDQANSYLMKAYLLDRYDLEILVNLAYTFNQVEFYQDALEFSNLALELDPQHPVILSNRAYAYLHTNNTDLALTDIKRSLANDGGNPMAHRYAGEIYLEMKDKDKACKSFEKAEKFGYSDVHGEDVSLKLAEHCKAKSP